jgi:hypothetical protein
MCAAGTVDTACSQSSQSELIKSSHVLASVKLARQGFGWQWNMEHSMLDVSLCADTAGVLCRTAVLQCHTL